MIGAKEYAVKNRASEVLPETVLSKEKMNIGVSVDGSRDSRGWVSKQENVGVCFDNTGKVVDVILKTTNCEARKNMKHKR